ELLFAPGIDQVFHTCEAAIFTIPEVALHFDDRRRDVDDLIGRGEAEGRRQAWISLVVAMAHSLTATDENVVSFDLAILVPGQQAEVVAENVDAIVFRQPDRRFELTG